MKEIRIDTEFFGNAIEFSTSIRELRIFLHETEKFFEERKKTLEPENEYDEDLDEEFLFYYWFPNLQRRNFVISLVTIIENETRAYCETLYKHKKVAIKHSQLRGTAIEKFLNYAEKLGGLKYDFDDGLIEKLKNITEIRNCVVHANGFIDDCPKQKMILEFSRSYGGIKYHRGHIYLTKQFCLDTLELIDSFFNEIFKSGYFEYEEDKKAL
jgi:hypothetical protein